MKVLDCIRHPTLADRLASRRWESQRIVGEKTRIILDQVRRGGDAALLRFIRKFDSPDIDRKTLRVSSEEIAAARRNVSRAFLRALAVARTNIARYHRMQRRTSWSLRGKGLRLRERVLPLQRVGIYVPGGRASYPSTVLMNAIPARIAGVPELVMATPGARDGSIRPEVLVAAAECGLTEIYRIGGAQAIAALAFGTESIRAVDKITGPGNAYVAEAKKQVYGMVGIDMIAGPTELVIVADRDGNSGFIAADMIAQAEHDEHASSVLITTAAGLIPRVQAEIRRQLERAPRRAIARKSLLRYGALVLVRSLVQAADIVNRIAPEHCEVVVRRPEAFVGKIRNAGAIFVGEWSTEALGDYILGPNHTLPTLGTARFSSPLGVYDFVRYSNVIEVDRERFHRVARHVEILAEAEGLFGHAASTRIRRQPV